MVTVREEGAVPLVGSVARRLLVVAVRGYQALLSPLFMPSCRYYPSCSGYAIEAIELHGAVGGMILAALRLLRCNLFFPGGYDPVPARSEKFIKGALRGFDQRGLSAGMGPD